MSFAGLLFLMACVGFVASGPIPQFSLVFNPVLDFSPSVAPTLDPKCLLKLYSAGKLATTNVNQCNVKNSPELKHLQSLAGSDLNPFDAIEQLKQLRQQRQGVTFPGNQNPDGASQIPKGTQHGDLTKGSFDSSNLSRLIEVGFDTTLNSVMGLGSAIYKKLLG
ncbi:hypothetical protein K493DRAFT_308501 [Basidiobolus meristosporus CBS 931.73]|uniref:Uncharacterized protein n=1 Tax=Basidiobolus meristosporus CBS 931.73 TaxID=1314790 RepID=A0A1Y1X1C1_9FUNG|nr:hypothetical protein K493DRAFT_308501 [Basidiobolus meristosporus CBS 931.73]|eukprot:ORX79611.1 hypothetical protein K493DRAFT_308501 [Basidiobolus meristosporus CBS 931.73]